MGKIEQYLYRHPVCLFLACFAFILLYVWLLQMVFPVRFEDNDDVTSAWIASGVYTGMPDAHLVFVNAVYGSLLAGLYSLSSSVEWYSVLFLVWLALSAAVCVYVIIRERKDVVSCLTATVITLLFLTYFVLRLQFTTVAASLAFAGLLLLSRRSFVYGGLMLLAGSLIRFEAAGMTGLMMMPLLINEYKFDLKKAWMPLGAVLLLVFGCYKADSLWYRSPEWQKFMTCCNLTSRGKINDNPNCWRVAQHLPEGVSETNFSLITAFAPDPETATPLLLSAIEKELKDIPITKKIKNIPSILIPRYKWWFLLILPVLLSVIIFSDRRYRLLCVAGVALWILLLCVLQMNASVKPRVFVSMLMPLLCMWYISAEHIRRKSADRPAGLVLTAGLCVLLGMPVISHLKQVDANDKVWSEQRELLNHRADRKVITDGADLHVEYIDVFGLRNAIEPGSFINPYCFSGCPLTPEFMSYRDFLGDELVLFTTLPVNIDMRLNALRENYGIDARNVTIAQSDNFALVKIVETPEY